MPMVHKTFQSFLPISCYPSGDVVLLMCGDKLPCNSFRSDDSFCLTVEASDHGYVLG
jgi:hypothetical protein